VANRGMELWFSRKCRQSNSWDSPQPLTTTFANDFGRYAIASDQSAVHVCWLDRRHEKSRSNLLYPRRGNYELAYSYRGDSDGEWARETIVSKDLLYAYAPTMSVEGNRLVIAWAGAATGKEWHNEYGPNDIYYVTSADGGRRWTDPLQVTDAAKDGVT